MIFTDLSPFRFNILKTGTMEIEKYLRLNSFAKPEKELDLKVKISRQCKIDIYILILFLPLFLSLHRTAFISIDST
jgi:hypothetical protein